MSILRMSRLVLDAFMGVYRPRPTDAVHDSSRIRYNLQLFRTTLGVSFSEYVEAHVVGHDLSTLHLPPQWGYDVFCFDNVYVVLEIFPTL